MNFDLEKFKKTYRGTEVFCETKYFKKFQELLKNKDLLDKIRFINDYLKIPPVKVFITYYRDFFNEEMKSAEKQGLGACFGYLYRFVYGGYEAEQTWVGDSITTIKTASYFKNIRRENHGHN